MLWSGLYWGRVLLKKLNLNARDLPAGAFCRSEESTSVYEVLSTGLSSGEEYEFAFSAPSARPDLPYLEVRLDLGCPVTAKKVKRKRLKIRAPTVIQRVEIALEPRVVLFPALLKSFLPSTYAAVRIAALTAMKRSART